MRFFRRNFVLVEMTQDGKMQIIRRFWLYRAAHRRRLIMLSRTVIGRESPRYQIARHINY